MGGGSYNNPRTYAYYQNIIDGLLKDKAELERVCEFLCPDTIIRSHNLVVRKALDKGIDAINEEIFNYKCSQSEVCEAHGKETTAHA